MKPLDALPERLEPLLLEASFEDGPKTIVDLVVSMAYADGKVDRDERSSLRVVLETIFASYLTPSVLAIVVGEAIGTIDAKGPIPFAESLGKKLAAHGATENGLRVAILIGLTSEGLSKPERDVLDAVARGAGAPGGLLDRLLAEHG